VAHHRRDLLEIFLSRLSASFRGIAYDEPMPEEQNGVLAFAVRAE